MRIVINRKFVCKLLIFKRVKFLMLQNQKLATIADPLHFVHHRLHQNHIISDAQVCAHALNTGRYYIKCLKESLQIVS